MPEPLKNQGELGTDAASTKSRMPPPPPFLKLKKDLVNGETPPQVQSGVDKLKSIEKD